MAVSREASRAASLVGEVSEAIDNLTRHAGRFEPLPEDAGALRAPEFRRVVVGVDGSRQAEFAIAWARDVARAFEASVTFVHAVPSFADRVMVTDVYGLTPPAFPEDDARLKDEARKLLEDAASAFEGLPPPEIKVVSGRPVAVLAEVADTEQADLVIVGSRGPGILERALVGSVADGVKDAVSTSTLIAKTPPEIDRILVGVDGSRGSKRAALAGLAFAEKLGFSAEILAAMPEVVGSSAHGANWKTEARGMRIPSAPKTRLGLEFGPAARVLLEAEPPTGRDLIVVGSRGLSGVRGAIVGSVSRRVVHASRGSVLVVKGED